VTELSPLWTGAIERTRVMNGDTLVGGRGSMLKAAGKIAVGLLAGLLASVPALADDDLFGTPGRGLDIDFVSPFGACDGDCAIHVFTGRQTSVSMPRALGLQNPITDGWGFQPIQPIWDWPWEDSGFVGIAASRRLLSVGFLGLEDALQLEGEVGFGQRVGSQTEIEVWGALYARWTRFPWEKVVRTTVGISTGLNWASGISAFEVTESSNDEGSQLLHYLSPEITFALPDEPENELVIRLHHRSGGGPLFGADGIFNGTWAGSQFLNIGMRYRF